MMNSQLCGHCNHAGCNSRCSKCKDVYYCDRKCQVADWKNKHKRECGKISPELEKRFEFTKPGSRVLISTKEAIDSMLVIVHNYYDINKNGLINFKEYLEMTNEICCFESSIHTSKTNI